MGLFKQLLVKEESEDIEESSTTKEDSVVKKESTTEKESITKNAIPSAKAATTKSVEGDKKEEQKIKVFDTSPNEDFWFHYGPVVKNLAELREAFLRIDDDLYNYHAKGETNNFAEWVKNVFGYEELAKHIEKAKTKEDAYKILKDAVE